MMYIQIAQMLRTHCGPGGAMLLAVLAVLAVPALAQDGAGPVLEEVIVTAQKREQNLQEVPVSITAFSEAELARAAALTLVDLEKNSPNTQLRESRGTNSTLTAFIRGIGQQDPLWGFEPGVGLYVDDQYIARPQAAVLDLFDVERIEVLRGPQGTLYGKNTIGGAVKYVTRSIVGPRGCAASLTVGSYGQQEIGLTGSLPVVDGVFYLGGGFKLLERDGYGTQFKDYDKDTGDFGRTAENYNKDVKTGRLRAEILPADSFSILLSADKTQDDSNNRCGSRFAANRIPAPNGEFFGPLGSVYDSACGMTEVSNVESSGYSATFQYEHSDAMSLKYIFADREGNTETFIDFDGTPLDTFEVPAFYRDDQTTHELQLSYLSANIKAVGGLYHYKGNAAGAFDALFAQFGGGVLSGSQFSNAVFGDVDTTSKAAYLNVEFALADDFTLIAGARYTDDEKAASVNRQFVITSESVAGTTTQGSGLTFGDPANDTVTAIRTNFSKEDANNSWSEFSPTLKFAWDVSADTMLYGGWSRGFKSGGFDMRADAVDEPNVVEGYDPEIVDTLEFGVKADIAAGRVRLNAAIFRSEFEDMQLTVQTTVDTPAVFSSTVLNAGKAEIQGVELEGTAQITQNLTAKLVLGFLDAEFIEINDAELGNVARPHEDDEGNALPPWEMQNAPDWNGQLSLSYSQELGGYGNLSLTTALAYRDAVRIFDQTASVLDQPSYSLWDASAVWDSPGEQWRAVLLLKNIRDEEYRTGGYNFPATAGEDAIVGFYGAPRTWTAELSYRF
ncbi:MAG: TonB-dependent receptor [Cellvibrionales bacterium]|nr:TonB-dependent receptor [Cellvibrionales bacterium]